MNVEHEDWYLHTGGARYYFSRYWGKGIKEYVILERNDQPGKYWISPRKVGDEDDIGPLDSFEAAEACFLTMPQGN